MPIRAESDDGGIWRVFIENEPECASRASIIDRQRQDNLTTISHGVWLFVGFSVWKVTDYDLVTSTLRALQFNGATQIRIYGYDYAEELNHIFPFNAMTYDDEPIITYASDGKHNALTITGDSTASPIWMLFFEGALVTTAQGVDGLQVIRKYVDALMDGA